MSDDGPRGVQVIVVRHGPAEDRDPTRWPDDRLRPLSAKGTQQTRRVADGLAGLLDGVACVASGPAERSQRTADLVGRALDPPRRVALWPELDLDRPAAPILARVRRELRVRETGVLVGHDPVLAELVGLALTGEGAAVARLTKGGAAALEFPASVRPGSARLLWLLTRKQLAAMRG
jgi:phosphohistidine phosphatase SixA